MLSYLFNFIPWYVYAVVAVVVISVCWQWITPIWLILPRWLKITIMFIGMVFVAYVAGRNRGSKDERRMTEKRDQQAEITREKIHEKVINMDRVAVDRYNSKWMRPR